MGFSQKFQSIEKHKVKAYTPGEHSKHVNWTFIVEEERKYCPLTDEYSKAIVSN